MNWIVKMVRTIALIAAAGIISSLLTIGTTALVVDHYIQSALQQFNVPLKREPLTALSLWSALWNGNIQANGTPSVKDDTPITQNEDDALPVWGSVSNVTQGVTNQDEVIISPDALSNQKDQLPADQKDEIFRTLLQKLPQEDWQRISTLMEDGLTSVELTEVQQLLAKHLNDEEYKSMLNIISSSDSTDKEAVSTPTEETSAGSQSDSTSNPVDHTVEEEQLPDH